MPLQKITFTPGLVKDDSPLAAEGGWIDARAVRFVKGMPEVIGGWEAVTQQTFSGIARGVHAWNDLVGRRILAFGTADKLYVLTGGAIKDITPPHSEGVMIDPFTTAAGSPVVSAVWANHKFATGQPVTFSNQSSPVGGLYLNGTYAVTVIDPDHFTFVAVSPAGLDETGGGSVDYVAPLPPGLVDGLGQPGGYGTGTYGTGSYGITSASAILPRIWFLENWGETLAALPRGGALYQWQPSIFYDELVSNTDFATPTGWTTGAGWSISGVVAAAVAGSDSGINTEVAVKPGYVYRVTADIVRTAGSLVINSDVGSLGYASTPIAVSGHYSRRFRAPAGMTRIRFGKDPAFVGSIDNVSVKLESVAYRVDEAPYHSDAMFMDPHQIVVLLGTAPSRGVYNPMAVRWNDRQDITQWEPAVNNLAGDDILSLGGRLVGGMATRQQNLIWSDAGLYTMLFTGDPGTVFQFALAGSGCGLSGALAMAEHDGTVFWASISSNFYSYSGAVPQVIPCRLRNDFFSHISPNQDEKIACGIMPEQNEVWFLYPDARDGNECSRYAAFRWDENHFTAGIMPRSAFVKSGVFEFPIMFGTDGKIYFHEKGHSANGGVIDWFIESAYFDLGAGGVRMRVRAIVGDFKDLTGYADFLFTGRNWPTAPEVIYPALRHTNQTERIDCRITARQLKFRVEGSSSPASARFGAIAFDLMPTGIKR